VSLSLATLLYLRKHLMSEGYECLRLFTGN
jgi:hypothetical protein